MLWIDMDGVLNRYERYVYRGSDPIFLREGYHYYKSVTVDIKGIGLLHGLEGKYDYRILSSLPKCESIFKEHYIDKRLWLCNNAIYAVDKFFVCTGSKVEYVKGLLGVDSLTKEEILVDDYNPNLCEWEDNGGTAIKFINSVNTASSWKGYKIHNSEELMVILKSIII